MVGRSTVVGRPVAYLLLNEDATVTIAHSQTPDIGAITRDASVVVVGVGRAGFLKGDMLAPGATVIDAGINVEPHGIVGDVDVDSVSAVAAAIAETGAASMKEMGAVMKAVMPRLAGKNADGRAVSETVKKKLTPGS